MDSVTISLLTVGAGDEVWSLYGHTAIRYQDRSTGADLAINYGAFSFEQPFFALRFVFGLTDYEMAIFPMSLFMQIYKDEEHRCVLQQDLNLTVQEKQKITNALYENYLPSNRTYRSNYFYDNCTTRARDIILLYLNNIRYDTNQQQVAPSYREMTHQWNENHRWMRFGNDLLLGIKADFPTTHIQRQFLPDSLRKDFESIHTVDENGKESPLISKSFYLITPQEIENNATSSETITPRIVFVLLFVMILLLTALGWYKHCSLWILDTVLLTVTGLAGLVLFVMIFSKHPTVQINLQILLLNPLSLLFLYPTIKAERKNQCYFYWKILTVCLVLMLAGAIFQDYAEGIIFLALSLLIRCIGNMYHRNMMFNTKSCT